MATVPIFDGKNYNFWCVKMRTLFLSMNLWDMVENGYEEEVLPEGRSTTTTLTPSELQERKQRDATALSKIQQGVSDSIFPIIMTATKAKEAWDILQQKYYQVGKISSHSNRSQMDTTLYEAAVKGYFVARNRNQLQVQNRDQLEFQLTPNKNTLLHVAALFGQTQCIIEILKENNSSSLLKLPNIKGDTTLHMAARNGHLKSVQALVNRANELDNEPENGSEIAKEMLRAKNEYGDTALHEAVRYQHSIKVRSFWLAQPNLDLVKFLVEKDLDPLFTYMANNAGETPLYLAAEKGYHKVVSLMLNTCRSLAYDGPGGRTALHAAVISNNGESTKALLDWKSDLAKKPDMYGWTPLHYAARFGLVQRARQLLVVDKSTAYLTADEDDKKIALHIAASQGHVGVMKELISQCLDCWEMVSSEGQNILHFAAEHGQRSSINFILKDSLFSSLINQKDVNGNTPLHLLAVNSYLSWNFIDHPRVDKMNFNIENWTPWDILANSGIHTIAQIKFKRYLERCGANLARRNVVSKDNEAIAKRKQARGDIENTTIEELKKMGDSHLIVAALIATVTFAAGFTMPGGYESKDGPNHGMAILTRKAAFQVFVVTDTIALLLSTFAAFIYISSTLKRDKIRIMRLNAFAGALVIYAIVAMLLAFVTGSYAVLPRSTSLPILLCVIASLASILFFRAPAGFGTVGKIDMMGNDFVLYK